MAKANKKVKEYEKKTTIRLNNGKYFDIFTVLTYTPFDGGKGGIVKVGPEKATMEE